jgi:hypothetical protein
MDVATALRVSHSVDCERRESEVQAAQPGFSIPVGSEIVERVKSTVYASVNLTIAIGFPSLGKRDKVD